MCNNKIICGTQRNQQSLIMQQYNPVIIFHKGFENDKLPRQHDDDNFVHDDIFEVIKMLSNYYYNQIYIKNKKTHQENWSEFLLKIQVC